MRFFKINILAIAYIIHLVQTLSAQQPYLPKFNQADPLWQHVLVNPLFQKHPKGSLALNPHTCISTQLTTELLVDSFLFSVVPSRSELIFLDGLIVQKININTGEVLWLDILYDQKIDSIGYVSLPYDIYMRKDGNIEFCGNRKVIDDNIQIFDQSYRAVYDFETGQKTLYYDKSNKAKYPDLVGSLNGRYKKLNEDSLFLCTYNHLVGGEKPERGLSFCLVNAAHDSIRFLKTIIMDPQMPVHRYTFRAIKAVEVNDSIYVVLLNLEAPQGSSFAGKNILYLFNYKDINNIHLVKSIDITEYAIYDWRFGNGSGIFMNEFDGKLYIMGQYYELTESKQFNYIVTLDDTGKVLEYKDKIETNDGTFYLHYKPIHISDTLQLFWAYKSKNTDKEISYDIVKMNDKKEMEYLASFFPIGNNEEYFSPHNALWVGNRLIISGVYALGVTVDENGEPRHTYYLLEFDLDDLKKGSTTVSTSEPIGIGEQVVIYPNPTLDKLYIKGVDDIQNIYIYDSQGKIVPTNSSSSYDMIDLEIYPQGVYFIKIKTTESTKTLRVIKK